MGIRYFDGPRPRIFGHRGAAGVAPENTLLAFAKALATGANRLELDVHGTRDGTVVVFHDATLDRTTDGTGPLQRRSLSELQELDAGYHFCAPDGSHPFRGKGVRIPTLKEFLATFPDVPLNIEIKQDEPAIEAEVFALLDWFDARERTLLAAENASIMARIRAAAPEMITGMSTADVVEFLQRRGDISYQPPGAALQVPCSLGGFQIVTSEVVTSAHALGIEVHVWVINDESTMEALLDLGVDGLMTDFPALAQAVLSNRLSSASTERPPR